MSTGLRNVGIQMLSAALISYTLFDREQFQLESNPPPQPHRTRGHTAGDRMSVTSLTPSVAVLLGRFHTCRSVLHSGDCRGSERQPARRRPHSVQRLHSPTHSRLVSQPAAVGIEQEWVRGSVAPTIRPTHMISHMIEACYRTVHTRMGSKLLLNCCPAILLCALSI